jgi:Ca-activated chloride channel homolog
VLVYVIRWAAAAALAWPGSALGRSFATDAPAFVVEGQGTLILERTSVRVEVQVGLAVVDVRQEFHNPFDHPVDATYLFPLPPEAAVRAMSLTCGDRRIEADLLDRAAARARYDAAAAEGRKAALLEQHRPNLFQQSVAALCPGEDVVVDLQYVDPTRIEDGRREIVFPTTVGPRYRPGDVPEPPLTALPAHAFDVEVVIDEGMPVASVWSDSHEIEVEDGAASATIRNALLDRLPNKDFHLAWTFAGSETRLAAVSVPPADGEDGYLGITLEPALLEDLGRLQGRELLFVLDESCSMQGEPFAASVATVRRALGEMRPDDRFNLVRFSDTASSLFDVPQAVTSDNLQAADAWLRVFDGGGTEMTRGIVHSLDMAGDPERLRLVLMLTDGYIGAEDEVLTAVRNHLGRARLFSLGVGSAVNRHLLDALADEGRGDVAYHLPGTPVAETVDRFWARIAHPALTDVAIDWGGLDVTEVYPSRIPDVFAGQPVRVVARYRGDASEARIRLTGNAAGEAYAVTRPLRLDGAGTHEALPALWARRKIADLYRTRRGDAAKLEADVTEVAMVHHLVTEFTSLVATEETPSTCGAAAATVDVPSMMPGGVMLPPTSGSDGAAGMGGLGIRGTGPGGGGSGYGKGGGNFGAKGVGSVATVSGDPIILGSLDRGLISEVIKRHMNQIRYCYQRELQQDPGLAGKVVMKFTVGADGAVSSAEVETSTLGSATVEGCILGRFQRMTFPVPAGSGVVVVRYPLVFSAQ